jgi:XisH protein
MPRKDKYHTAVRLALEKEGWLITDDPLTLQKFIFDEKEKQDLQWIKN